MTAHLRRRSEKNRNTFCNVGRQAPVLLIAVLSLLSCLLLSCAPGDDAGFGIFLVDSGELVLSDQHIKVYHKSTHEIELNEKGIEKWNSYMTYETIPRLEDGLFGQKFLVKAEGKEAYRGGFSSMAVSSIQQGITIQDTLFRLDGEHNTIRIVIERPRYSPEEDPRNDPAIFDFLGGRGLLD